MAEAPSESNRNTPTPTGDGAGGREDFRPDSSQEPDAPTPMGREPAVATWKNIPEKSPARKPGILERLRGKAAAQEPPRRTGKQAGPDPDWSPGGNIGEGAENAEADALLLDHAFLKRTFK